MNCDDPKFTAHLLGEDEDLTPAERAEIEALISSDPAAASEAAETRALAARLRAELAGEAAAGLEEGQRAAVLQAAVGRLCQTPIPFAVSQKRPTAMLAAIAACLVVGVTTALVYRDMREAPTSVALASADLSRETMAQTSSELDLPTPLSPPAQQVQLGDITMAKATDGDRPNETLQAPPAPAVPIVSTNLLPNMNPVQELATYRVSGSMVSGSVVNATMTLKLNGFTGSITQLGSLDLHGSSSYSGATVTPGGILTSAVNEQPPVEFVGRVGASPLAMVNVKDASAGLQPSGAAAGAAGPVDLRRENPLLKTPENLVSTFGSVAESRNFDALRNSLEASQHPPKDAVQIAGLLNRFSWNYPAPLRELPFSVTVEVNECPWMPEHRLVRIGLKTNSEMNVEVEFHPEQVGACRLLGNDLRPLAPNGIPDARENAGSIHAGQTGTALYELVPTAREQPVLASLDKVKRRTQTLGLGKDVQQLSQSIAQLTGPPVAAPAPASTSVPAAPLSTPAPKLQPATSPHENAAGKSLQLTAPGLKPEAPAERQPDIAQLLPPASPKTIIPQPAPTPRPGSAELLPPAAPPVVPGASTAVAPLAGQPYLVEENRSASQRPVVALTKNPALFTIKLRYQDPHGGGTKQLILPFIDATTAWEKSSPDFRFAAAVAGFGMLLRDSPDRGQLTWDAVAQWAREGLGPDDNGERKQFLELIEKARTLSQ